MRRGVVTHASTLAAGDAEGRGIETLTLARPAWVVVGQEVVTRVPSPPTGGAVEHGVSTLTVKRAAGGAVQRGAESL